MIKTIESKRYGTIKFLIDELDVPILDKFNFYVTKQSSGFYLLKGNGKRKDCAYLHRLIMNAPSGTHVHHKNGNTLDNRRCNLEILTPKQHSIETAKTNNVITEEDIKEIILNPDVEGIKEKYNITYPHISLIKRGKTHSWCCPEVGREQNKKNRKTKEELQEIKYLVKAGINLHILSKKYNMPMSNLYGIRKGTRYKNVIPKLKGLLNG